MSNMITEVIVKVNPLYVRSTVGMNNYTVTWGIETTVKTEVTPRFLRPALRESTETRKLVFVVLSMSEHIGNTNEILLTTSHMKSALDLLDSLLALDTRNLYGENV